MKASGVELFKQAEEWHRRGDPFCLETLQNRFSVAACHVEKESHLPGGVGFGNHQRTTAEFFLYLMPLNHSGVKYSGDQN